MTINAVSQPASCPGEAVHGSCSNPPKKINLLGLDRNALTEFLASIGEPAFRATQILQWIHQIGLQDINGMTNISKPLRDKLQGIATIALPEITYQHEARDGTYKWILKLDDGNCIETVFIPEKTRGTLCISSQVGCALNCDFCSTGKQGFNRNLSTLEIIAQLFIAVRQLSNNGKHDHTITNVVMMGMGEPLLNLAHLIPALHIMLDDFAYGLSKRRVTVSTAGVVPGIYHLQALSDVSLAISLHAPNDQLRNQLVPINKKYPINELMKACKNYFGKESRRSVTIEYVMLKDVNDGKDHARELIKILNGVRVKVNLIPFNPFPFTKYQCSDRETILTFRDILLKAGLNTTIRRTRGDDIDAACGQLVGKVHDRTRRTRIQKVIG